MIEVDFGFTAGACKQFEESFVAETAADELVFGQNAVAVRVHSAEDFVRPHARHFALVGRFVIRHQIDRLQNYHQEIANRTD